MKKTKLLALMMPLFLLGMTGCDKEEPAPEYQHDKTYHWLLDEEGNVNKETKVKHEFEEQTDQAVAATCSAEGKKVEKCKVCGEVKESKIDKLAHAYVKDDTKSTASTCSTAGKTVEKCSVCGDEKETPIDKLAHAYVKDDTKSTASTCSTAGKTVEKCSVCGDEKETPLAKSAHTLGAGVAKTNEGGKEYFEYECSVCHEKTTNMIKFTDYVSLEGTFQDGKLSTDPVGIATWEVCLPAGDYDVYFEAKYSSSGKDKTLQSRSVAVTYNGAKVDFDAEQTETTLGLSTSEYKEFTFFKITATGGKDLLTLQNPHYRFVFNSEGYVTFKPVAQ